MKESKIIEIAERIVIDYANLSGRETANRAEFRKRVITHLRKLQKETECCMGGCGNVNCEHC